MTSTNSGGKNTMARPKKLQEQPKETPTPCADCVNGLIAGAKVCPSCEGTAVKKEAILDYPEGTFIIRPEGTFKVQEGKLVQQ